MNGTWFSSSDVLSSGWHNVLTNWDLLSMKRDSHWMLAPLCCNSRQSVFQYQWLDEALIWGSLPDGYWSPRHCIEEQSQSLSSQTENRVFRFFHMRDPGTLTHGPHISLYRAVLSPKKHCIICLAQWVLWIRTALLCQFWTQGPVHPNRTGRRCETAMLKTDWLHLHTWGWT